MRALHNLRSIRRMLLARGNKSVTKTQLQKRREKPRELTWHSVRSVTTIASIKELSRSSGDDGEDEKSGNDDLHFGFGLVVGWLRGGKKAVDAFSLHPQSPYILAGAHSWNSLKPISTACNSLL